MGRQSHITIAQRYRPFSHTEGASSIIPLSDWVVTAYPTRLEFSDFFGAVKVVELPIKGPMKGFTLEQDLERQICRFFGVSQEGYFEIHLFVDQEDNFLMMKWARGAEKKGEKVRLVELSPPQATLKFRERISLGSSKKQDVDLMWRRAELVEILPILYVLSQNVRFPSDQKLTHLPQNEEQFSQFIKVGFDSIFVPKRNDERFLGIFCETIPETGSPLQRLKEFGQAFRSLFITEEEGKIALLPKLPKTFLSGRFLGAKIDGAKIDFEWRKGELRSVIISPEKDGTISFIWPDEIRAFRIDKREGIKPKALQIVLKAGKKTVIDKFQK